MQEVLKTPPAENCFTRSLNHSRSHSAPCACVTSAEKPAEMSEASLRQTQKHQISCRCLSCSRGKSFCHTTKHTGTGVNCTSGLLMNFSPFSRWEHQHFFSLLQNDFLRGRRRALRNFLFTSCSTSRLMRLPTPSWNPRLKGNGPEVHPPGRFILLPSRNVSATE